MRPGIPAWALLTLSFGGNLTACRPSPDKEQLAAVERTIRTTDSLTALVQAVDTTGPLHDLSLFESVRAQIEARFADTLSPKEAEVLGNYHRLMGRVLPATLLDRHRMLHRLDSTRQRLGHLEHDLRNGILPKAEGQQAIVAEQAIMADLARNTAALTQRLQQVVIEHQRYRQEAEPILRQE